MLPSGGATSSGWGGGKRRLHHETNRVCAADTESQSAGRILHNTDQSRQRKKEKVAAELAQCGGSWGCPAPFNHLLLVRRVKGIPKNCHKYSADSDLCSSADHTVSLVQV